MIVADRGRLPQWGRQAAERLGILSRMAHTRYPQIDIMKGLAILGVLFTHAAMAPLTSKPLTDFYALQAMPVFIVLMGLNLAMSLRRQAQADSSSHYWRRLQRLAVPFAVVFAVSSAIAAYRWFAFGARPKVGPLTLLGYLPFGGAGNYFILILAVFTLVGPALWAAYRRWPRASMAAMLAADLSIELVYGALTPHVAHFSVYGVNPMRLLAAFAIGLWLADGWGLTERRNRWLLGMGRALPHVHDRDPDSPATVDLPLLMAAAERARLRLHRTDRHGRDALAAERGARRVEALRRARARVVPRLPRADALVRIPCAAVHRGPGARGPRVAVGSRLGVLPRRRVARTVGAALQTRAVASVSRTARPGPGAVPRIASARANPASGMPRWTARCQLVQDGRGPRGAALVLVRLSCGDRTMRTLAPAWRRT